MCAGVVCKQVISVNRNMFRYVSNALSGIRSRMPLGYSLWVIVAIKLFIMFAVLRLFFFPDFLGSRFSSDEERAVYVGGELVVRGQ